MIGVTPYLRAVFLGLVGVWLLVKVSLECFPPSAPEEQEIDE